jgi:hypothetical protein
MQKFRNEQERSFWMQVFVARVESQGRDGWMSTVLDAASVADAAIEKLRDRQESWDNKPRLF